MKNTLFLLFTLIFILTNTLQAQNKTMTNLAENLNFLTEQYPKTKIFVHTDKPFYTLGENIWYALYAVNASNHQLDPISNLAYVTLEDHKGNILVEQNLKLDGKFAHGDFVIDEKWEEGLFYLKAYTSYMKNYELDYIFSKEIPIWNKKKEAESYSPEDSEQSVSLRFFPEGGELISGLNSKVAFEISGISLEEITVLNSDNNEISKGKVLNDGLGYFNLLPKNKGKYHVKLNGKKFPLPDVLSSGYSFKVNALGAEKIYIDVLSSKDKALEGTFIIAHIRGNPYLVKDQLAGQKASFGLERNLLPEGVSQITLFNNNGVPLAERTFFIRHYNKDVNVKASIPYEYLNRRQETELTVGISGTENEITDGSFSISVVDSKKIPGLKKGIDIRSYLLLGSEFTSGINNIHQYFSENTTKTRFSLDILMMTRGWTRFKWKQIKDLKEPKITYAPEDGFTISGQVFERKKPVKAFVNFSIVEEDLSYTTIETDENGRFIAFGFDLKAKENLIISAFKKGRKDKQITKGISIKLDDSETEAFSSNQNYSYPGPSKENLNAYINNAYEMGVLDSMFDGMQIQLDEVVLKADKKLSQDRKIKKERGIIYSDYDKRVFIDSMPNRRMYISVFDMVRDRIPGVSIVGTIGDQRFRLRGGSNSILGSSDALVVVDGSPASYEYVNNMNADQIEFVDILKGLSTSAIYGTPNGVVAIYTRTENSPNPNNYLRSANVANILHDGYYESRTFYFPNYSKPFPGSDKPDLRTTLYWNPKVKFKNGNAKLNFYTADQITEYLVEIQGLTEEGIPFVGYGSFEVR